VTRGGRGVADTTVFAMQQGLGRISTSRTDSSGAYRLEGLEKGTYDINVERKRETVKLDGDRNLDFDLPTARVSGTVVESGSRQPLQDASVSFTSDTPGPFGGAMITTDSNGRFTFDDLEPKSYTLRVRKPGFQLEKKKVTAGDPGPDLTIELLRGEGLSVQVRDGLYNVPLRGLMARVEDATGGTLFGSAVGLDDQGRGEIPSLKPGSYKLYAQSSGYAPVELAVSVPSPTVPITLTPGGTVEIHAGSETLAGGSANLQFLSANGRPYRFSAFGPGGGITLATPVRRLENIAPGSYSLVGAAGVSKSFHVQEGRTLVVELP
jgi:protocatechuate 3,4-dioxygenase beta subunit